MAAPTLGIFTLFICHASCLHIKYTRSAPSRVKKKHQRNSAKRKRETARERREKREEAERTEREWREAEEGERGGRREKVEAKREGRQAAKGGNAGRSGRESRKTDFPHSSPTIMILNAAENAFHSCAYHEIP